MLVPGATVDSNFSRVLSLPDLNDNGSNCNSKTILTKHNRKESFALEPFQNVSIQTFVWYILLNWTQKHAQSWLWGCIATMNSTAVCMLEQKAQESVVMVRCFRAGRKGFSSLARGIRKGISRKHSTWLPVRHALGLPRREISKTVIKSSTNY